MMRDVKGANRFQRTRRRDTPNELKLRRILFSKGLRYLVDRQVVEKLRTRPDVAFVSAKVAVFVDSCFWHSCPTHGSLPKSNASWWAEKLSANRLRDEKSSRLLSEAGWMVIRVWEHEDLEQAADRIEKAVAQRLAQSQGLR
jgi:DNA mismatch endonuclease (patch repair protein)